MSLQPFRSYFFAASALLPFVQGANDYGSLDSDGSEDVGSEDSAASVADTSAALSTSKAVAGIASPSAATQTAYTAETMASAWSESAVSAAPSNTVSVVTYNQWGFAGSQSKWEPQTLSSVAAESSVVAAAAAISGVTSDALSASDYLSSSSLSLSVYSVPDNQTSNAAPGIMFEKDLTWKKYALTGGVVAIAVVLHAL